MPYRHLPCRPPIGLSVGPTLLALALALAMAAPAAWSQSTTAGRRATPPPRPATAAATTTTGVPPLLAAPTPTPAPAPTGNSTAEAADNGYALTIKTEEESPFSIVIAPWLKSTPRADLERPARLYDEVAEPIDPDVFIRRVDFYEKIYAVTEPGRATDATAERHAAAEVPEGSTPVQPAAPTVSSPRASPASPARTH